MNSSYALAGSLEDGLSDRAIYEQFFARLTPIGKQGAEWWAGQRSLTRPGICRGTPEFVRGCRNAKTVLSKSDDRRHNDPFYRQGWNSYVADGPTNAASPVVAPTTSEPIDLSLPTRSTEPLGHLTSAMPTGPVVPQKQEEALSHLPSGNEILMRPDIATKVALVQRLHESCANGSQSGLRACNDRSIYVNELALLDVCFGYVFDDGGLGEPHHCNWSSQFPQFLESDLAGEWYPTLSGLQAARESIKRQRDTCNASAICAERMKDYSYLSTQTTLAHLDESDAKTTQQRYEIEAAKMAMRNARVIVSNLAYDDRIARNCAYEEACIRSAQQATNERIEQRRVSEEREHAVADARQGAIKASMTYHCVAKVLQSTGFSVSMASLSQHYGIQTQPSDCPECRSYGESVGTVVAGNMTAGSIDRPKSAGDVWRICEDVLTERGY